jgi:hypothetical protein
MPICPKCPFHILLLKKYCNCNLTSYYAVIKKKNNMICLNSIFFNFLNINCPIIFWGLWGLGDCLKCKLTFVNSSSSTSMEKLRKQNGEYKFSFKGCPNAPNAPVSILLSFPSFPFFLFSAKL